MICQANLDNGLVKRINTFGPKSVLFTVRTIIPSEFFLVNLKSTNGHLLGSCLISRRVSNACKQMDCAAFAPMQFIFVHSLFRPSLAARSIVYMWTTQSLPFILTASIAEELECWSKNFLVTPSKIRPF